MVKGRFKAYFRILSVASLMSYVYRKIVIYVFTSFQVPELMFLTTPFTLLLFTIVCSVGYTAYLRDTRRVIDKALEKNGPLYNCDVD